MRLPEISRRVNVDRKDKSTQQMRPRILQMWMASCKEESVKTLETHSGKRKAKWVQDPEF